MISILKRGEDEYILFDAITGEFHSSNLSGMSIFLKAIEHNFDTNKILEDVSEKISNEDINKFKGFIDDLKMYKVPKPNEFDPHRVFDYLNSSSLEIGDIVTPPIPVIELFKSCNYKCPWCYVPSRTNIEEKKRIPISILKSNLIDPCIEMGSLTWCFSGGEPNLLPEAVIEVAGIIKDRTQSILNKKPRIQVLTNGFRVTELLTRYSDAGITSYQLTLSSTSPQKDALLRGVPNGINPIEEIIGAAKTIKGKGLRCGFNTVIVPQTDVTPSNISDIPEIIEMARKLGIDFVRITPVVTVGKASRKFELSFQDLKKIRENVRKAKDSEGERPKILCIADHDIPEGKPVLCGAGPSLIYIDNLGWTYPCNNFLDELGDKYKCWPTTIFDTPIDRIWKESKILRNFREIKPVAPECTSCYVRWACIGQCRIHCLLKFGTLDLSEKPSFCLLDEVRDLDG
jgi:radical SAM protein with 4Fe4S-binding SPASM domain